MRYKKTRRSGFNEYAENRNRTYDLIITNDALYQLSYFGASGDFKALAGMGQFN
jgi:hypothetical protein